MTTDLTIEQLEALLHQTTLDDMEIKSIAGQLIGLMQEKEVLLKILRNTADFFIHLIDESQGFATWYDNYREHALTKDENKRLKARIAELEGEAK